MRADTKKETPKRSSSDSSAAKRRYYGLKLAKPPQNPEVEVIRRALQVLGVEQLSSWIQMPNPSLEGRTPYSLLDSEEGRKEVEAVLGRIEHGIF